SPSAPSRVRASPSRRRSSSASASRSTRSCSSPTSCLRPNSTAGRCSPGCGASAPASVGGVAENTPLTEEQIRAATVGELVPHAATIELADYDPAWPGLFEREGRRVRSVLGERVLLLEHTGSTSVPGLAAKPIVDMTLVVADSSEESAYVPDLESVGYRLTIREPDWYEHRLLKGPD